MIFFDESYKPSFHKNIPICLTIHIIWDVISEIHRSLEAQSWAPPRTPALRQYTKWEETAMMPGTTENYRKVKEGKGSSYRLITVQFSAQGRSLWDRDQVLH